MTSYRKITEKIAGCLKPKEAFLFYCLALKSDYETYESNIEQKTLAEFYGIKDDDLIRKWLYMFQDCGLITIDKRNVQGKYGLFQRCRYYLNTEHYVLVTDVLKDEPISTQLKGFLILLKCKCLNGTNTTLYSQNRLAKELNISPGSISKYIKEAEEKGYIKRDKKGIHLTRQDIFLITQESDLAVIKNIYPEILTDEDIAAGRLID